MQISEGYVAIHGFPEGTATIARSTCLAGVHSGDIERVQQRRDEAFCKGSREYSIEYRIIRPGGEVRWVETRCFISYCNEGRPRRVIGVSIDVTERKRAEERQRALIAELDHRVKNVLANVSAVVSHTRQESASMADFVAALDGRIGSMATTHELLSAGRWQGISLRELVRRELAPYATRNNTEINGPEVVLCAEAGQAMAMVLHELATNAAKYGALSTSIGRVSIRWDRRSNGHARSQLVLEWREIGGPPVVAPSKPSYGTSTIRDLIPYELGGTVDFVLAADGARCHVALPACWLGDASEPISRPVTPASDNPNLNVLEQPRLRDSKTYRILTRGPRPEPAASGMANNYAHRLLRAAMTRDHIEGSLRAIDSHIGKSERLLFEHGKLMERLKDSGGDLVLAHDLRLNLETGLRLFRAVRTRLMTELEQD